MERPEDRIALIEWLGPDRRVQRSVDVHRWPLTLGRDLRCTVVLDDPRVAPRHARLWADEAGVLQLQATAPQRGLRVGRTELAAGGQQALPPGDTLLQLGDTLLRLRRPPAPAPVQAGVQPTDPAAALAVAAGSDPFEGVDAADDAAAAEGADDGVPGPHRLWPTVGLCALLTAWMLLQQALELAPDAEPAEWLKPVFALLILLLVWPALWALVSKLFQHHFDFLAHLGVVARGFTAALVAEQLLGQAAVSFGVPALAEASLWASLALLGLTLWAHLRRVLPAMSPRAWRGLRAGAAALVLAAVGLWLVVHHRQTDRWTVQLYLQNLPAPALRWHAGHPLDRLMGEVGALQAPLQARAAQAAADSDDADEAD